MFLLAVFLMSNIVVVPAESWDTNEIIGYHFHTYFFQTNNASTRLAQTFRQAIQQQIDGGFLRGCRLNHFNTVPRGPHPIGSYETCCNSSSLSRASSWFMQNHGDLSILLHPLTRWEILDHTTRSMWLGKSMPLDLSALSEDLGDDLDHCLPIPGVVVLGPAPRPTRPTNSAQRSRW
ncbi:putative DOPA 4,5-dioxygenase [Hypsibius exemplaris]|uniref:DOPA 4,5-dioxygenase n=1 Tax=Hypsibius exemplaris TaxID=2072580 RepID=A0A1W0WMC4_HYPEX|nr:putative DOPA 4,5-dioxygenase [Hypsibius exemplaris]